MADHPHNQSPLSPSAPGDSVPSTSSQAIDSDLAEWQRQIESRIDSKFDSILAAINARSAVPLPASSAPFSSLPVPQPPVPVLEVPFSALPGSYPSSVDDAGVADMDQESPEVPLSPVEGPYLPSRTSGRKYLEILDLVATHKPDLLAGQVQEPTSSFSEEALGTPLIADLRLRASHIVSGQTTDNLRAYQAFGNAPHGGVGRFPRLGQSKLPVETGCLDGLPVLAPRAPRPEARPGSQPPAAASALRQRQEAHVLQVFSMMDSVVGLASSALLTGREFNSDADGGIAFTAFQALSSLIREGAAAASSALAADIVVQRDAVLASATDLTPSEIASVRAEPCTPGSLFSPAATNLIETGKRRGRERTFHSSLQQALKRPAGPTSFPAPAPKKSRPQARAVPAARARLPAPGRAAERPQAGRGSRPKGGFPL